METQRLSAVLLIAGFAVFLVASLLDPRGIYQTSDPLKSYEGAYTGMQTVYYWLSLGGLLLFGVSFLQAGLPAWLGHLTAGAALVYGIVFLVSGESFLTPFLVILLSLAVAIILLRQKPQVLG